MSRGVFIAPNSLEQIEWMWQSNPNPWSESEPAEWSHYSDVENLIIEEAFSNKQSEAMLDGYHIDLIHKVQIADDDANKQRSIKRVVSRRDNKHLREARFMEVPLPSERSFGGQYGWVSPFIVEVRKHLGLKINELPSKDNNLVLMLVETAALGIIEEGKQIRKQREAEKMANLLREQKNKGMKEVWRRCAYLYSLESFLYKTLNASMRLIGSKENEQFWRSKIHTLGPFCLLLWDDPLNKKLKTKTKLYRGADLKPEQITTYENMTKDPDEYYSFQAFTSCSRNRKKAEQFGNTLFIIDVFFAFTADLSPFSKYSEEEEELVTPGACFRVQSVKFDQKTKKYLIRLELRQRFCGKYEQRFHN